MLVLLESDVYKIDFFKNKMKKSKKNKNFVGGQEHSKDTPYSISRSETLYKVRNKCFYEEYASILDRKIDFVND